METQTRIREQEIAPSSRRAQWYEQHVERFLPRYALLTLPLCLSGSVAYNLAHLFTSLDRAVNVMTPLDERIPLRPEWIVVYFGAYIFWVVNYWLIARRDKERWFRFLSGYIAASVVVFLAFTLVPTTMTRPEITGDGFWPWVMRFLYAVDPPLNLAPSLHCFASWQCAIALHSDRKTPLWYRVFSYVFALMVCASTLLVRQHCLLDVVTGVALAQISYLVSCRWNVHRPLMRAFDKWEKKVFQE